MGFANSVSEQWQRAFEVKTDQWPNWPKQRENCSRSKLTDILVLSRCCISSPVLLEHMTLTFAWPSSFPPACLKQKCMVKVHLNQQRFGRVPRDDPLGMALSVPAEVCPAAHICFSHAAMILKAGCRHTSPHPKSAQLFKSAAEWSLTFEQSSKDRVSTILVDTKFQDWEQSGRQRSVDQFSSISCIFFFTLSSYEECCGTIVQIIDTSFYMRSFSDGKTKWNLVLLGFWMTSYCAHRIK